MPKTQGQLVEEVRASLDEYDEHGWQDEEIRRWINAAARDIARRCECLQDTETTVVLAGVQSVAMPADVVRSHRVEWLPGGGRSVALDYYDYNTADQVWWQSQNTSQGTPSIYTMWGFPPSLSMLLYPTPSAPGSVKVYYYRLPSDLALDGSASATTVEVPEGWWDLIAEHAEYKALRKDADPRWQEAKSLYDEHLQDLHASTIRWTDAAGMISTGSSMVPGWLYDGGY